MDEKREKLGSLVERNKIYREIEYMRTAAARYADFIHDYLLDEEKIGELKKYLPKEGSSVDINKVKVWLLTLRREHSDDIPKILSFLEQTEYGWSKGKYHHMNPCMRKGLACKSKLMLNDRKAVESAFGAIDAIFFDKEYGAITLLLFNYCLASLFSSHLNQANSPRYIQIACDRHSALYKLIQEIVTICDVNMGIFENCSRQWACGYEQKTVYPTQAVERSMAIIDGIRDVPTIIDGHENLRGYHAVLREMANKSNKGKYNNDKCNLRPILICPSIKSGFNNVLNIDLTGEIVSEDYLALIRSNKKLLTSLVVSLHRDFIECLFPGDGTEEDRNKKYLDGIYPFSDGIAKEIQRFRNLYAVPIQIAKNAGVLSFFFFGIMRALDRGINKKEVPSNKDFAYKGQPLMQTAAGHSSALIAKADRLLLEIHKRYTPVLIDSIVVKADEPDPKKAMRITKKARKYAIEIVKCYQSFGVSISIAKIAIKGERYIFDVELLEGTRRHQVFKEAENVRIAAKLEYLKPTTVDSSTVIVASEKLLKEDDLIKIMDSPLFKESTLKIPFAMGYDIMGEMVVEDLAEFTHTLIGGTTGSGKSTALHTLILSIVCKQSSDDVKLLIFDFGITFLSQFRKVPHLAHPIVDDMATGHLVIDELYSEMERRRKLYHKDPDDRSEFNKLPSIFCIIDEFPQFISYGNDRKKQKELQSLIMSLLAQARGLKIFMVLAAQDPTEKNMKCGMTNLETVLAFKCGREHNSRVMLGESGAEKLLGNGDMLFKSRGIKSVQGAHIIEENIAAYLEKHMCTSGDNSHIITIPAHVESSSDGSINLPKTNAVDEFNKNIAEIIMILLKQRYISNDAVQKQLEVAYHKANEYMAKLEEYKLILPLSGKRKPRKLVPTRFEDISPEAIEHLARHGYGADDIESTFVALP